MYHRVANEVCDPWGLAVSPEKFADQLDWIKQHRTPLSLSDFVELNSQGKLPRDAIAITFDDGYACNAALAMPLLEHLGVPATIFLPADLIADGREFWWDELERIVMHTSAQVLELDGRKVPLGERQSDDVIWPPAQSPRTPRQRAYGRLWKMTFGKRPREIDELFERWREQGQVSNVPRDTHRSMTRDEVRTASSDLIEFGSHALTHPSLPQLDPAERVNQIFESIEACAELSGTRPRAFAYPYGDYDADSRQLIEEAGYLCACRADGSFVRRDTDRFALPRIFVGDWDSAKLARQLGRP